MVTAPVHKGVINDAGIAFTGHTEFLAARTRADHVVMMLVGGGLRVALATTHLAVKDIAPQITAASLEQTLRVLQRDLTSRFGLAQPRIAVAGLNPHAGESGHLGREEIEIIIPLVARLRAQGMQLTGPLPADTLFNPARLRDFDCVLAMYHDQGLPVLKYASFGTGVNVTLGRPSSAPLRQRDDRQAPAGCDRAGIARCPHRLSAPRTVRSCYRLRAGARRCELAGHRCAVFHRTLVYGRSDGSLELAADGLRLGDGTSRSFGSAARRRLACEDSTAARACRLLSQR